MAVTTDFQVELNGLLLGPGTTDYEIINIDGLEDLPDVRTFDKERALRHGYFSTRDLYGKRVVTIIVEVWSQAGTDAAFRANIEALKDATAEPSFDVTITGQLPGDSFGQWRITGRPRKRAVPINIDYALHYAVVAIQVDCFDPRVYSAEEYVDVVGVSTSAGGLSLPLDLPLDLGGTGTSGTLMTSNLGNIDAPWLGIIAGPVGTPQIQNLTTGQVLRFNITLAAGETLELDSDLHRVLFNGIVSRYDTITSDSDWWDIPPGGVGLRFTGSTAGSPTFAALWRDARV